MSALKHVWLVMALHSGCEEPLRVFSSQAGAKAWISEQDPSLVFSIGDNGDFVAHGREQDWVGVYGGERLPFGGAEAGA